MEKGKMDLVKTEIPVKRKIDLVKIRNPVKRRITFAKRKMGMLKKARELSVLCDVEIALIIFSDEDKLYELGSPNMEKALRRYRQFCASNQHFNYKFQNIEVLQMELQNFQKLNDNLEKLNRHMIGEEIDSLSTRDLHNHEKKLEKGLRRIRARKEKLLKETLKSLRKEKEPCTCTDHNEVDTSRLCEVQPYEDENERAQDHDSTQFMPQI